MGQGLPPELRHNSPLWGLELAVAVATPARIHGSLCSVDNQVEVHAPSNRLLLGYGPFVHVCFEPSGPSLPLTQRPKALVYGTCD
jgi:hypothetical protein